LVALALKRSAKALCSAIFFYRTPLVGGKEFLEPTDRQDIEVVGRLVEEQTTRVCGQNLGQKNS
jgi:hypothetical protein